VVDGASVYTSYMRDGGASGTYIRLVSGLFRYYPDLGGWGEIASGSVLVAGAVQFGGLGYTYAVATQADALAVAETVYGGIYYRSVQDAFGAMVPGSTITLINDVNRQLGTSKACVLDLGGHVLSYSGDIFEVYNCEVTIRNGTIRELGSGVSCFKLSANGTLNLESDVSIEGAAGQNTNCFYIPGDGATVNILGADISTTRIFSSNWPQGVSVSVTGAGKYPGEILWPGIPSPASGTIAVAGGWWNEDPSAYLASGLEGLKVSDHGESYAARGFPCRYHVHSGAVDSGIIVIVR
ncbi:MAG: hypothetical protein ILO34_06535, partial [Kiritimatiellae bacterium]|nr:hypothetical protein [Kiritimatiellia bacterium]